MNVVLPAPLGPSTAWSLPLLELDGDVADRLQPAEMPGKSLGDEDGLSHRPPPSAGRLRNRPATLAIPPGRNITSAMIVAPSRSCQCVVSD